MKKTIIVSILLCLFSVLTNAQVSATKKTVTTKGDITLANLNPTNRLEVKGTSFSVNPPTKRVIKIDLDSIFLVNNVEINETFKGDSSVTFATYTPSVYQSPSPNDSTMYMNITLNIQVRTEKGDTKKAIQKRLQEMNKAIEEEEAKVQERIKRREKFSKSN